MNKISTLKTILKTIVGASIATSFIALPVKAHEDNLRGNLTQTKTILSQNFPNSTPRTGFLEDRSNNTEPTDNLNQIIGITGLAIGTVVIGYHLTRAYKPSLVNSIPAINNQSASLIDRVSPKLRRELLRLVHDRQTASRLLSGTLISHPDRSPNWVAEKVIYDLKRDR